MNLFSEAMGQIGDRYYEEAADYTPKKTRARWKKWGALAACLCLLAVGIAQIPRLVFGDAACDGTYDQLTVVNGALYYTSDNAVYCYENGQERTLAPFSGELTETETGLYLRQYSTGEVYQVDRGALQPLGSIPRSSHLLDVREETVCYMFERSGGAWFGARDRKTGESTETKLRDDWHFYSYRLMGDTLYFSDWEGAAFAFDRTTETIEQLYQPDGSIEIRHVRFYKDFLVLETLREGLYVMGYEDETPTYLTEYAPDTNGVDYYEGKLYFVAAFPPWEDEGYGHEENLVALDVKTGEIEILVALSEGGTSPTYTDLAMTEGGYYYADPSATSGGLFYHDLTTGEETRISKN